MTQIVLRLLTRIKAAGSRLLLLLVAPRKASGASPARGAGGTAGGTGSLRGGRSGVGPTGAGAACVLAVLVIAVVALLVASPAALASLAPLTSWAHLGRSAATTSPTSSASSNALNTAGDGTALTAPAATTATAVATATTATTATTSSVGASSHAAPPARGGWGRAPAGAPTSASGSSGASTASATPTASVAPSPTTAGATASPGPSSAPYDATVISVPSNLHYSGSQVYQAQVTLQNTGSANWTPGYPTQDDALVCVSVCASFSTGPEFVSAGWTASGQQQTFTVTLAPPVVFYRTTMTSHWTMMHNGIAFGAGVAITFTVRGWHAVMQQYGPDCANPAGVSWSVWQGDAANTLECDGAGLVLAQGAAAAPRLTLTSVAGGYDPTMVVYTAHVHFDNPSTGAALVFLLNAPADASQCGGNEFYLYPSGLAEETFARSDCSHVNFITHTFPASQDYDILVENTATQVWLQIDGQQLTNGVYWQNGAPGFTVADSAQSGDHITISNFQFYQYGW